MTNSFVLVTQYFPPERGAAQTRLGAIVAELARRGHDIAVVTALPNYPTGRIFPGWKQRPTQTVLEDGVPVTRVWVWAAIGSGASRMINYLSFAFTSIIGLMRAPRPDWYLVEYPTLFGALPSVIWAKLWRRRVAVIVADLWVDSIVEVGALKEGCLLDALRRLELWMFQRCDAVTAVTEGVRDRLVHKGVDPTRLAWLPNGADTSMFSPGPADQAVRESLGFPDGNSVVLYAGTHGYVHGLSVVLDAAVLLVDTPVTFLLVGGGSEKADLVQDARTRGIKNVVFRDPVSPQEVASLLRVAVAGLATVRSGDLYRTIRSAKMLPTMAVGKPVIYSGDDEGSRLIDAVGAGIAVPPEDSRALADAVLAVLGDPVRADEMGRAGREWIVRTASWERLVDDWINQLATITSHGIADFEAGGLADPTTT